MLQSIRIQNLALISTASLEFGEGLTAVTGESGSGKSVLLDAIALVTGCSRPRVKARSGAASGFVEAEFRPQRLADGTLASCELTSALDEHGLLEACLSPDEPLVLTRRIDASGRTRCFIQGQTVSRTLLARVGACLVELCGQSEAHNLRTAAAQLVALDRFAHLTAQRDSLERLVTRLRKEEAREKELERQVAEAERRRDFLEFQLSELASCDLADLEEREARLAALDDSTRDLETHREIVDTLVDADRAVIPQIRWLSARLAHRLRGDDESPLARAVVLLDAALTPLEEVTQASSNLVDHCARDQAEAEELRAQLDTLRALARKHRVNLSELGKQRANLESQLENQGALDEELTRLRAELVTLRGSAHEQAEALHMARKKAAQTLDKKMKRELSRVGLQHARFETHLSRGPLTLTGVSHLDFGFSANPGQEPEPLSRVASGGELSRVLLCFRLATESAGALLVFDEIDAGAGGRTAEMIAASLERAGRVGQVLCVTHWPQVAGLATTQLAVHKHTTGSTTETVISPVQGEQRLCEISRMLGGSEVTAREHASGLVKPRAA